MAARCKWKSCEEPGDEKAVIAICCSVYKFSFFLILIFAVKFSNGQVKNTDQLNFRFFKHCDETNPRKKRRRIVVAESDRLSYVGSNFGPGSLQCNSMCNYFLGVLDKTTMQMKVHSAQIFNLQPVIPGETATPAEENESKTYREKVDALIEAFGTTKQKRALSSRRMNEVGNDTLQKAVARAAGNVIEQKGLEVLSSVEFDSLQKLGEKLAGLTVEEQLSKENFLPKTVKEILKSLPQEGESRDRKASCAWYLSYLIRLAQTKKLERKLGENECPHVIFRKVLRNFTIEKYDKGRLRSTVTASMVSKIASHCLALLLHTGDKRVDLTLLHRDLQINETKMLEVAKAMGLTLSRQTIVSLEESGLQDQHRMASLELPLVCYERRVENRKRKKM
ncbi:DNA-directed RNA polymerase I subunit RPA49 [Bagarius yarrelli]|uniref:DNA-directed RNA polymerase I subunit RPA49 n=1 Tax=Bagarius yarrelli TaxID=175774 RepID=A0A556UG23_BAGYA|nr:DNA-directed RNA polymerase I subunit RPA49 [Bagarius yarrelli]